MLSTPFKSTAKVDIATPLNRYLQARYNKEEAARHAPAVERFQSLRNKLAEIVTPNEGARETLLEYFGAVHHASQKFPVSETSVKIGFAWTDVLRQRRSVTQYSWLYEQCNVLYQLASIESQLGTTQNRDTAAGIEAATKRFCSAAGLLTYLRDNFANRLVGTVPLDLSVDGLKMFIQLNLAQAQSCYYEMARLKQMKPEPCAKLAGQAADFYRAAAKALPDPLWDEIDKEFPWSVYIRFYAACFDGASFWQYAQKTFQEAHAKGDGYGAEIAWLTVAENAASAAVHIVQQAAAKNKAAASVSTATASALLQTVGARKAEAVKDNNTVYLNAVPRLQDLPLIPRAELAKVPPTPDLLAEAQDFFAAMVPAEAIAALQVIDERLTAVESEARARCQKATEQARADLAQLGLPGYLDAGSRAAGADASGLPVAVWDRVRMVQAEGGLTELDRMYAANAAAGVAARDVLAQACKALDDEEAADAANRAQYGQGWNAAPSQIVSAELRGDLAKYTRVSEAAMASDGQVKSKLDGLRAGLAGLSRSKAELDASVPAVAAADASSNPAAEAVRTQLRESVAELNSLMELRPKLAGDLKATFNRQAASALLAPAPTSDHSPIIERLVNEIVTGPAQRALDDNLAAQARVFETIKGLHQRFQELKCQDERTRAREAAIQEVCTLVDRFQELRSNLREGEAFYRDLRQRADQLLVTARDLAAARSLQARELTLSVRAAAANAAAAAATPVATAVAVPPNAADVNLAARMAAQASIAPGPGGAAPQTTAPWGAPASTSTSSPMSAAPADSRTPAAGSRQGYNPFDSFEAPRTSQGSVSTPGGDARTPAGQASYPPAVHAPTLAPAPAPHANNTPAYPTAQQPAYPTAQPRQAPAQPAYQPAPAAPAGAYPGTYGAPAVPSPPPGYPVYAPPAHGYAPQQPPYGYQQPQYAPAPQYQQPQYAPPAQAYPGAQGGYNPYAAPQAGAPPAVTQLINMGFERGRAERALVMTRNDINAAVDAMLSGRA